MTPSPHSLPKLSLLVLSLLLTPTVGLAATQDPAPEEEASSTEAEQGEQEDEESLSTAEEDESPRLLDEPEPYHPGWRKRSPWGLRLAAEAGLGLGTGSLGIIPGAFVGAIGCLTIVACVAGIVLGAELGFTIGMVAGVYAAGKALGADGKLLPASLGALAGIIGSIVLLTSNIVPFEFVPIIAAATVPPLIGAMAGYELFVSPEPEAPAEALVGMRIRPLLAVSPQGAFMGLGGRF